MVASNKNAQIGPPRFAVAVHILVWLAKCGCVVSSAEIAGEVNSHATFMRRVLATLAQRGFVEAREGRDGGYSLKMPPDRITLADVFAVVTCDGSEAAEHSDCGAEGEKLDDRLVEIMAEAERRTLEYLKQHTIADFI
ncbi:RrF2 family transcriptional regulator [Cohnella suwonensis]|uniref:RrF2 family transcriptional regulator n=1 Tax=Cohnella suwonensis TaxID=696072 RepID=A0ABW0LYW3_9BACL